MTRMNGNKRAKILARDRSTPARIAEAKRRDRKFLVKAGDTDVSVTVHGGGYWEKDDLTIFMGRVKDGIRLSVSNDQQVHVYDETGLIFLC